MTIDEAYIYVQSLANKTQRGGYLNSDTFNLYAERAQIEEFMVRYGNPMEYQPGRPVPRISYQVTKKISDDLRPFIVDKTMLVNKYGQSNIPQDYVHSTNIIYKTQDKKGVTKTVGIEEVDNDKLGNRLSSSIVAPNKLHPICVFRNNFVQFYPENLGNVTFTYLRKPKTPKRSYNIVNNREVYDSSSSVDFEFPDNVHNSICSRILSYLGIKIREQELIQYAEVKSQKGI